MLPAAADRFTPGRPGAIDRIVLHTSTTTFAATVATFQGGGRLVSAHYVVDEYVDQIAQCVRDEDTSWGCGNWPMNQRCLNIEHVDNGDWNGTRPDQLYERSARLVALLCRIHPIPLDRASIRRHNEIIATACPDALDVDRIVARAKEINGMAIDYLSIEEKVKATVRAVIMGEPALTADALKQFLVANKAATPGAGVLDGVFMTNEEARKAAGPAPSREDVQQGHGKG